MLVIGFNVLALFGLFYFTMEAFVYLYNFCENAKNKRITRLIDMLEDIKFELSLTEEEEDTSDCLHVQQST